MNLELMVVAAVNLITNELTTNELIGVNMCMMLEGDPRHLAYYDRISPLFDSKTIDGKPIAHDLTRRVVFQAVQKRVAAEKGGDR
jgi:hypothetical protein